MKRLRSSYVPVLAILVVCFSMLIAPISARADQGPTCKGDPTYLSQSCMGLRESGTYVYWMSVRVHVPNFSSWSGQFIGWVQPPGQDFKSFTIVNGYATNYWKDWQYRWNLYQTYPSNSQACAEFTTKSGYYPAPVGPICFYIN